jgi:DNA-binding transcriptional regulator of glucitol operon
MKMKQLLLVVFVTFQMIISSAALAWSPLDSFEYALESMQQCHTVVAGSEEDQDGKKKGEEEEEEEEPDCD